MKKLTIGTSGFTYPSGRKGESLIYQLSKEFSDHNFIASGRGWPIKTRGYSWSEMEKFFQKLDIYVCTSSIEGIGYPVLESLACGVPVVVPIGVGVFDELDDTEGIFRYEVNNYNDLKDKLQEAIDFVSSGKVNQRQLRKVTENYTIENWCLDHHKVFENYLFDRTNTQPKNQWQGNACIFYVAYGKPALECVTKAIASVKKYLPEVPTVLVSDKSGFGEDIFVYHKDSDIGARSVKTKIYELVPKQFEYVLYLDADTEIVSSDVTVLFDLLQDGYELIFCFNPPRYILVQDMQRPDNKDEIEELTKLIGTGDFVQLNGGVFAYRRTERTEKLFTAWRDEYLKYFKRDQAALDRALFVHNVQLLVLGQEFNTITRYTNPETTAGILHYPLTARRYRGKVNGRLNSPEAWANIYPEPDDFEKWKQENETN